MAHSPGLTALCMGEEKIDLRNLKQRELLILLHSKVESIEKDLDSVKQSNQRLLLKVNTMETTSKVWGSIAGLVTFIATLIIEKIITSL